MTAFTSAAVSPTSPREPGTDTQPFVFAGSDGWGHQVRGSIVALDAADAFAQLLRRGVAAQSVAVAGVPEPYRVAFVESRQSPTIGDLVRRLVDRRREVQPGYII